MTSALDSLTAQQRRFVEGRAAGMPAGRAYEAAGYRAKGRAADAAASRMLAKTNVSAALAEVQSSTPEIADKAERQRWLTSVLRGEVEGELREKLKACELLARIGGDMVIKSEVKATVMTPDQATAALLSSLGVPDAAEDEGE
jgi:phage terminase small subunit